ncbi:MAG: PepSY1/2 domain-containing protein [Paenisporosarcina sp.]
MKILTGILTIGLIVMGFFLYNSKENEMELNRKLHANYTNQMSDASQKLDDLQKSVIKASVFNDPAAQAEPLEEIWRLSSDIRSSIASLPLNQEFSNDWLNYLGRLGDFAKLKSEQKVTEDKWLQVASNVSKNLNEFSNEWENATTELLAQDEPYSEWDKEVTAQKPSKNWTGLSKSVKGYTESDFPLTASETDSQKKKELQNIKDKGVTEQEAEQLLKKLFPRYKQATIVTTKSKKGAPYPFYHVQFNEGIRVGYADFTKKGGHLLSLLAERPIGNERISQKLVSEKALKAVKSYGFEDVEIVDSRENRYYWHLTFVRVNPENKARVYDDTIQMKLAKDDGEVLGLSAMEYIQKEKLPNQDIIPVDWTTFFTKDVKVQQEAFAYTDNKQLQQRLCYELLIVKDLNDQTKTFRILVDTETKEVLKSELLS